MAVIDEVAAEMVARWQVRSFAPDVEGLRDGVSAVALETSDEDQPTRCAWAARGDLVPGGASARSLRWLMNDWCAKRARPRTD